MEKHLKSCPFCGGKAESDKSGITKCLYCGISKPTVMAWNTRSAPEGLRANDIKQHFQSNMLDGDDVNDCGGAMLSAKSVYEYIKDTFGQPSSVPVLGEEEIEDIIKKTLSASCTCNDGNGIVCVGCFYRKDLATALASRLGQKKEVRWPKPQEHSKIPMCADSGGYACSCGASDANSMLNACIQAYNEAYK